MRVSDLLSLNLSRKFDEQIDAEKQEQERLLLEFEKLRHPAEEFKPIPDDAIGIPMKAPGSMQGIIFSLTTKSEGNGQRGALSELPRNRGQAVDLP
jgi:hypothetical protein